ncbi:MAG: DUF4295 domain-containing protein [Rhodothermales bacterium]
MAKKQSFGDKVRRHKATVRQMAKVIVAEKKPNGQYRYRAKMVPLENVQDEIAAARS